MKPRPRHRPTSSAVWLCTWHHSGAPAATYVDAASAAGARRELERRGLPQPDRVVYAGFSAASARSKGISKAKRRREIVHHRARAALRLLAAFRASWPLSSHMGTPRYSDAALRDFVGNMGLALGRLHQFDRDLVERMLDAERMAAHHQALELNARRAGDKPTQSDHRRRASDHRNTARRLAKRQAVRRSLDELDASLAGELEVLEGAALWFEARLSDFGYTEEEAARFTSAWRRVLVPRL